MNIKNLLIDLDGTLVQGDTIAMRFDFIRKTMKNWSNLGGPFKILQAFHRMQAAVEGPPDGLTNDLRMVREFAATFQLPEDQAAEILEKTVAKTFSGLKRHFAPIPGAQDFINWAKTKFPMILATNPIWLREVVEYRVRWAGLDLNDFVSFTHAKRMHSCKPRVEYYQELIDQEKLNPSTCLMIGNDRRKDLPASQIGIPVYIITKDMDSPRTDYQVIPIEKNGPTCWTGTFAGLKHLLQTQS